MPSETLNSNTVSKSLFVEKSWSPRPPHVCCKLAWWRFVVGCWVCDWWWVGWVMCGGGGGWNSCLNGRARGKSVWINKTNPGLLSHYTRPAVVSISLSLSRAHTHTCATKLWRLLGGDEGSSGLSGVSGKPGAQRGDYGTVLLKQLLLIFFV